ARVTEGDVAETDGASGPGESDGAYRGEDVGLEGEKLEEIAEEEGVGVELADVVEEGPAETHTLLEGLIEHGEVAEDDLMTKGAPAHPGQSGARRAEGEESGEHLGGAEFGREAGTLGAQFGAEGLEGGVKVVTESEEADFGGGFAGGEQPIVIPGVPFIGGGAHAPVVLVESVAEDDVEGGETAGQEGERQADAEGDQD